MRLLLDEEEIWIVECIKEAHIDCGFHIRDVIKKAKAEYGLCRSTVYEIVSYLEFHGLIKTNNLGNRELDQNTPYFVMCSGCGKEIPGNESVIENGQTICEECCLEGHQNKLHDPMLLHSKKLFRKNRHGLKETKGSSIRLYKFIELTELQQEIYEFIAVEGQSTPEKISKLFGLMPEETNYQLAALRQYELVKCRKIGDEIYVVLFDS
jgi:hypothetical protein